MRRIRVREAVIADLVALVDDPLEQRRVQVGVEADDEEDVAVRVLAPQDVQDLRRPHGVGPVVEGQRDLLPGAAAAALDDVGRRVESRPLAGDETAWSGRNCTSRGPRGACRDLQHFAFAFVVEVVPVARSARAVRPPRAERVTVLEDRPDRRVLGSQPPQRHAVRLNACGHIPQLVERGDRVEEPDVVRPPVLVRVLERRVQDAGVECNAPSESAAVRIASWNETTLPSPRRSGIQS